MSTGVWEILLGGLASSVLASASYALFERLTGRANRRPFVSYSERLKELTSNLTKASGEVDAILKNLAEVANSREATVRQLELNISVMESNERELKDRIGTLSKTPIPAADHFIDLLARSEKRSARRDYMLFGAGVIITTIIAIILQLVPH